jgi:hypothetical protein
MADLRFCVDMAASPNLVFAIFVPQRMPHWYGTEMNSHFEVQGGASEFQAGQKVRISGTVRGREVALTVVIVEYEWLRVLDWRFQDSYGVRGMQRWEVAPSGAGTRLCMMDRYEMPGRWGRLVDWILTRHAVDRRDRDSLARLRRLVERPGPRS